MFRHHFLNVAFCAILAAAAFGAHNRGNDKPIRGAGEFHSEAPVLAAERPSMQSALVEMRWYLSKSAVLRGWRRMP